LILARSDDHSDVDEGWFFRPASPAISTNSARGTAIALFGLQSSAALATIVGFLVEVPVMLSVIKTVNASKSWCERRQ